MIASAGMFRGWCAATAILVGLVVGSGRAEIVNRIVATIDGEPITAHELETFAAEHGTKGLTEHEALEALITDKILEKEASSKGIHVKDDDVDRYIAQVKASNHLDDARFAMALQGQGLTVDQYRQRVKAEIAKTQLVNREIRGRVSVSNEEIERYYKAHVDEYAMAERVTVRDIVFPIDPAGTEADVEQVRVQAEQVRAQAQKGSDFGKLAAEYSKGPAADKGGLLGTFSRGEMDAELEKVVFQLKEDEISDLVRVNGAFHLLKVDKRESGTHRPLGEVKEEIRNSLYDKALEQRFEDWLSRDLRERHSVEVLN